MLFGSRDEKLIALGCFGLFPVFLVYLKNDGNEVFFPVAFAAFMPAIILGLIARERIDSQFQVRVHQLALAWYLALTLFAIYTQLFYEVGKAGYAFLGVALVGLILCFKVVKKIKERTIIGISRGCRSKKGVFQRVYKL